MDQFDNKIKGEDNFSLATKQSCYKASQLWSLQDNFENLETKVNKTVLCFNNLLDEEEKETGMISEGEYEEKASSRGEQEVHRRASIVMNKADKTEDGDKKDVEDSNITDFKTTDKFHGMRLQWKTCDFWSLPEWLRINNHILKGHRPPLPSYQVCIFSIFRIHTETVNIWTHLIGCLLFVALFLHAAMSSLPFQDKLVISPFFVGAILCLGLSSVFHIFLCHSEPISEMVSRLDYCGIILIIIGSFVPWLYYGFFCESKVKILYLAGVITLGICVTVIAFSKTFNELPHRTLRATVFTAFGLSGFIPVFHFISTEGLEAFLTVAVPLLFTCVIAIAGGVIYAIRFPECLFPGKCDIYFQSHQVFHVLVILAALIDYIGIVRVAMIVQFGRSDPDYCLKKPFYYEKYRSLHIFDF